MTQEPFAPDELIFLVKIKDLALTLSLTKLDTVVDTIKRCVLEYQHCIPDEKPALDFIEQLIITSEKETTRNDISQFLTHLSIFWEWMVLRRPLDLIYVGQKKNFTLIEGIPCHTSLRCTQYIFTDEKTSEDALAKLSLSRPVLLVDNQGEQRVGGGKYLGLINIEVAGPLLGHRNDVLGILRKNIDMVSILNNNLRKLKNETDLNKVILGSSFAYFGMHDALLTRAVNLSIASGDAEYNKTLVEYCISECNVKNFVIVIGFFELFHKMSKGENGYFYLASEFLKDNDILYASTNIQKKPFLFHHDREPLIDLLQIDVTSWLAKREIGQLRERASLTPEKSLSTDFTYSSEFTRRETEYFARFYEREGVAESNKLIFQHIVEQVKQVQGRIYFVIQPFTPLYNEIFHPAMRQETKDFLATIADGESSFCIDLSEDTDFAPEDYSDAHHLNFTGAQKLYRKLAWLQL